MLVQWQIDGKDVQFGYMPDGAIGVIYIRTSGFPIDVPIHQLPQIKSYLKSLVENLEEDGYVLYNGVINYKNDINLECLK